MLISRFSDFQHYEQILLGSEYYNQDFYKEKTDKLITIPMDRNISKRDLTTILQCRKHVLREKPDVLFCHSAKAGIYGRIACLGTKTKVIYNPHGWAFNMKCSRLKRFFYKAIESVMGFFTDLIVCISDYEKSTSPRLIPSKKIVTVLNGIDVESNLALLQSPVNRTQYKIPQNAFVVGIVARISVQKGIDLFVDAAAIIKRSIPNAYFLIVGGKSENIDIENKISSAGLESCFIITGEVVDAVRFIPMMDVAVLTSRWEGFGLVLAEYMLAQKAIVAFAVDAVPEVLGSGGECGLLVEPENVDALSEKIIELHGKPEVRERMGKNGYLRVIDRFDESRVARELDELVLRLGRDACG